DDIDNDDDDVWCNPEDEDNLEHRVKLDLIFLIDPMFLQ
ncbi:unnamed protein product, partial [Rotaria sp. Silwood1]